MYYQSTSRAHVKVPEALVVQADSLQDHALACRSARGTAPGSNNDGTNGASEAAPSEELAYEGLHILEILHLPAGLNTAQLEQYAACFDCAPPGPVVRCASLHA